MDSGTATVLAALIAGFVTLIGTLLKFFSENRRDHGRVMDVLNRITGKLDKVDGRLTHHIDWHLQGGDNGQIAQRDSGTTPEPGEKG